MRLRFKLRHAQTAAVLLLLGIAAPSRAEGGPPLQLNDGERVLFLGNGFIENDQAQAFLETRLQRRFSNFALTFRYMGWSGDTVRGNARTAGYEEPEGLARLEKEVRALTPTVIFLAYGMNESFEGSEALPRFLKDYDQLLASLAPLKARLVILSPTYHEDLGRPFPDPATHNQSLRAYTKALKGFAEARKLLFIDLFHPLEAAKKAEPSLRLTTNGLLLTRTGYALTAKATEEQLGFPPRRWQVHLSQTGKTVSSEGAKIRALPEATGLRFEAIDTMLPIAEGTEGNSLRITGFDLGTYRLKIDGQDILKASAAQWQQGIDITNGPPFADAEKLRAAIGIRNQLFYRRWRPYNDHSRHWTYIAGDFKLYDQEIAAQEQRIAELRVPRAHVYEITPTTALK